MVLKVQIHIVLFKHAEKYVRKEKCPGEFCYAQIIINAYFVHIL